jgi:hypothetical protein
MCMFSRAVIHVGKTKLYVSCSKDHKRQLTVYSNQVNSPAANAMILAVPNPESIEFVDLSTYPQLFNDLKRCFAAPPAARSRSLASSSKDARLVVHDVGSFRASIALSAEDLDRADPSVFTMPAGLCDLLETHYAGKGMGFVVCQLKDGNHDYHPFAYSHNVAADDALFVPTLHYHEHPGKAPSSKPGADWDHEIYVAGAHPTAIKSDRTFVETTPVQWKHLPEEFRWAAEAELAVEVITDPRRPNKDITYALQSRDGSVSAAKLAAGAAAGGESSGESTGKPATGGGSKIAAGAGSATTRARTGTSGKTGTSAGAGSFAVAGGKGAAAEKKSLL